MEGQSGSRGLAVRLLPVLKPAEWEGLSQGARAHLWLGTNEMPLVVVGYAWENSDELTYVTQQTDEHDDPDVIVRQAFDNLEEYESGFETVEANGSRLLVSAGRPFAAERVLCESHMLRAHDELGSARVVVSIPKRGAMVACAWGCSDEAKNTIVNLHLESWKSADDQERITDHLVVFDKATKIDTMAVSADGVVEGWL